MSADPREPLGLTQLGDAIETAHQAARGAARTALDQALRCGALLLAAKAQVDHGNWLPWLQAHTTVTPRQSQVYMRLARHRDALTQCEPASHLTLTGALATLTGPPAPGTRTDLNSLPGKELPLAPPPADASWDAVWAWAERQYTGPFNGWDLEEDRAWREKKLLHHLGVPAETALCLWLAADHGLHVLRLVPTEALETTLRHVYAQAQGTALPVPVSALSAGQAFTLFIELKLSAQRLVVRLADELERRKPRSEAQLRADAQAVATQLREALDQAEGGRRA